MCEANDRLLHTEQEAVPVSGNLIAYKTLYKQSSQLFCTINSEFSADGTFVTYS